MNQYDSIKNKNYVREANSLCSSKLELADMLKAMRFHVMMRFDNSLWLDAI